MADKTPDISRTHVARVLREAYPHLIGIVNDDDSQHVEAYRLGVQSIGQGRENAKMFLKDNPAIMAEIEAKVKVVLSIGEPVPVTSISAEDEA